jgi:hypothetical protein
MRLRLLAQCCLRLVAWLEETRIRLPLKGVECRFGVCAAVADFAARVHADRLGKGLDVAPQVIALIELLF